MIKAIRSRILLVELLWIAGASAQAGTIRGTVTDNGIPVRNAQIHILRDGYSGIPQGSETLAVVVGSPRFLFGAAITFPLSAPGAYEIRTGKKGNFVFFGGLPAGVYSVAIEVKGKLVEQVAGIDLSSKQMIALDFDISKDRERSERAKAIEEAGAADERARVRAACTLAFDTTANKRVGDLTVKEEQQVRACQALNLYPPR